MDNATKTTKRMTIRELRQQIIREHLSSDVAIMRKYELSPNQLVYLKCIWLNEIPTLFNYLGVRLVEENQKLPITREEVNDLYFKKLITTKWDINDTYPDLIEVTRKTKEQLALDYGFTIYQLQDYEEAVNKAIELGNEFWDNYPKLLDINGTKTDARRIHKFSYKNQNYSTPEHLKSVYVKVLEEAVREEIAKASKQNRKAIYNTIDDLHNEIIVMLNDPRSRKFNFTLVTTFILNKSWESLKELLENDNDITFTN